MHDQASNLRLMATAAPDISANRPTTGAPLVNARAKIINAASTRVIAVTGGKGGVGKSNIAVNVALELAARHRRVTLLDADLALANADVLLGLNPQYNLGHVLNGQRSLEEVVVLVEDGLRLIPGGSGVEELANLTSAQHQRLIAELRAMEDESDYMIVDTASGIGGNVTGVLRAASEIIVVTTPDPTALVDAYATIKVLHRHAPDKRIRIVVNDVVGIGDADQVFAQLCNASQHFLSHRIEHLGTIPRDAELAEAVRQQVPVVHYAPNTPASRALRLMAKHIDEERSETLPTKPAESFWSALAGSEA